jgi:hypothetical protein
MAMAPLGLSLVAESEMTSLNPRVARTLYTAMPTGPHTSRSTDHDAAAHNCRR